MTAVTSNDNKQKSVYFGTVVQSLLSTGETSPSWSDRMNSLELAVDPLLYL